MLYREIMVVCSEIHTKHTNTLFWYFADRASRYIYLNINQLDALNFDVSTSYISSV